MEEEEQRQTDKRLTTLPLIPLTRTRGYSMETLTHGL